VSLARPSRLAQRSVAAPSFAATAPGHGLNDAVHRLMREMGRAVEIYVTDTAVRKKITEAWMSIRLA